MNRRGKGCFRESSEQIDFCTDIGITSRIFNFYSGHKQSSTGCHAPTKNRKEKSRDCLCQSHLNKSRQTLLSEADRATGSCAPYKAIIYIEDNSFLEQTMIYSDS